MLDATRSEFTHYRAGDKSGLSSNVIWDISNDSRGNIWLAVDQGGLVRFNEQTQLFEGQRANVADASSLQSDQLRTVFEDRNGDLWLGLFPFGVNFFNHTTSEIHNFRHNPADSNSLSHSSVLSIHQTSQGEIWLGTEDGLDLFQPEKGQFQRVAQLASGLPAKAVLSIQQFDETTLWLGTWSGGLARFDTQSGAISPIDTTPAALPNAVNSAFVWDILRDKRGDMWLGTEFNGANHYDVERDQFTYYRARRDHPASLASDFV